MPGAFARFVFDVRPVKQGGRWHVYAKYPGGYKGQILSFESEAAATAWLKSAIASQIQAPENESAN
jgi:hypothetical protein